MNYTPQNIWYMRMGWKDQTRRPLKDSQVLSSDETVLWQRSASGQWRERYRVGRTYAIAPGRTKPQVGRLRVTALRIERLHDITEEDAGREGMAYLGNLDKRGTFQNLWRTIYAEPNDWRRWEENPLVVVVTFEVAEWRKA